MQAGSTFLRADSDKHLWVVISDPERDPEHVLIVNLTTKDARKETVCLLSRGDHPWITHDSCVNYADSRVTTRQLLLDAQTAGAIRVQAPMSEPVLHRIREGAMASARIPLENADVLINQGLVADP